MSETLAQPCVGDWIQTFSGARFWPMDPRAEEVRIEDIAHALALVSRFGGHCRVFYSVAQHSVLVSEQCGPEDALAGLLHDSAEAYLGDIPRPLKRQPEMVGYRVAEARVQRVVFERFGLPWPMDMSVKIADEALLATEARDLMGVAGDFPTWELPQPPLPNRVEPWDWATAKREFLYRFALLTMGGTP